MNYSPLLSISPIDGRYQNATKELSDYFSEFALIKYRYKVEVEYLIFLAEKKFFKLKASEVELLRASVNDFSVEHAQEIKETEKTTNHDVKAVEYFLKKKMDEIGAGHAKEWVHFGLTSQDINNTSIPWSLKNAIQEVILPELVAVVGILKQQAIEWQDQPMLAKTHGQPASPTVLGKEWWVFVSRIESQIDLLIQLPYTAKFGGATGI
mgnify:CR=1 FL=1